MNSSSKKNHQKLYNLWIHDDRFSKHELIINPDIFPSLNVGDLVEIFHPSASIPPAGSTAHQVSLSSSTRRLILQVTILDKELLAKQSQLQPTLVTADYVEISFRDQYISRSDMWRLTVSLTNMCVYVGKKLSFAGCIRAQIKEIYLNGRRVSCGFFTDQTKAIFRSESSKMFIFIQLSREMWEFDEDGELYIEKAVHGFLPELFRRWKKLGSNHVVSLILFSRVFYDGSEMTATDIYNQDDQGRIFRDFYKVISDWESKSDWSPILAALKKECSLFRKDILLQNENGAMTLKGELANASQGNILEAVNLALTPFDKHYVDRDLDLVRTGLSMVVITAGNGLIETNKYLLRLTTQRMLDNGVGLDLVCLSKPPLFCAPIFSYTSKFPQTEQSSSVDEKFGFSGFKHAGIGVIMQMDKVKDKMDRRTDFWDPLYYDDPKNGNPEFVFFTVPDWVDCSFYYKLSHDNFNFDFRRFMPRCKMPEVQLNCMDQAAHFPNIPYLDDELLKSNSDSATSAERYNFDAYDEMVFKSGIRRNDLSSNSKQAVFGCDVSTENVDSNRHGRISHISADGESLGIIDDRHFHKTAPQSSSFTHLSRSSGASSENDKEPDRFISGVKSEEDAQHRIQRGNERGNYYGTSPSHLYSRTSRKNEWELGGRSMLSYTSDIIQSHGNRGTINHVRISYAPVTDIVSEKEYEEEELQKGAINSVRPININAKRKLGERATPRNLSAESVKMQSDGVRLAPPLRTTSLVKAPAATHARPNLISPWNPLFNQVKLSSSLQRWHHIYPKLKLGHINLAKPKWHSLCTPACLPITTDSFPTNEELMDLYQEYTYTVSSNDEMGVYHDQPDANPMRADNLLLELICLRLAQGFQLVTSPAVASVSDSQKVVAPSHSSIETAHSSNVLSRLSSEHLPRLGRVSSFGGNSLGSTSSKLSSTQPYFLSMGHHVHKLSYDASGQNVEVKRYVRKLDYATQPISYSYSVWPKCLDFYQTRTIRFGYPQLLSFNWNFIDHLLSGYTDDISDSPRIYRARFILIPLENVPQLPSLVNPSNEQLDEEELRLAGFHKFIEMFQKCKWNHELPGSSLEILSDKKKGFLDKDMKLLSSQQNLKITFTTFSKSSYVKNELKRPPTEVDTDTSEHPDSGHPVLSSSANLQAEQLTKDAKYSLITAAMQHPTLGVRFRDRRWHLRLYERVFIGSDCVEWMVRVFSDIHTREEAVQFGNLLLSKGVFMHVNRRHRFLDGHYFYRLKTEYYLTHSETEKPGLRWFRSRTNSESGSDSGAVTGSDYGAPNAPRRKVELSRRMFIDLDPSHRSDRKEVAILHYDTVHNPKHCYHFQLHWINCTAQLIEELLQTWSRHADRCGLKLIEAPLEQSKLLSDDNPFQTPILVTLAVPSPKPNELNRLNLKMEVGTPDLFFEIELLKAFGFLLDMEGDNRFPEDMVSYSYARTEYKYTQFVHRSGTAFILTRGADEGFLWVSKPLLWSH
ncbi:hypothetical protein BKA69DRAFT_1138976, partial [Paraphysoderma sedebokerense]